MLCSAELWFSAQFEQFPICAVFIYLYLLFSIKMSPYCVWISKFLHCLLHISSPLRRISSCLNCWLLVSFHFSFSDFASTFSISYEKWSKKQMLLKKIKSICLAMAEFWRKSCRKAPPMNSHHRVAKYHFTTLAHCSMAPNSILASIAMNHSNLNWAKVWLCVLVIFIMIALFVSNWNHFLIFDSLLWFFFDLGVVVKGFDMGVASMKKGEKAVFTFKSDYAYGAAGSPPNIPPNSTLIFEASQIEAIICRKITHRFFCLFITDWTIGLEARRSQSTFKWWHFATRIEEANHTKNTERRSIRQW